VTTDSSTPPTSAQSGSVSGNYNIFVQASGHGIAIDIGLGPHLTLYARHRLAREPKKSLDLLNPINRAIPVLGREKEQRELETWLDVPGISDGA
jgi:hypothetical protein